MFLSQVKKKKWISLTILQVNHNKMNKNLRKTNIISQCARIILEQYGIFIIVILSFFVFTSLEYKNYAIPLLGSYCYAFFKLLPSMNKFIINFQEIINNLHQEYISKNNKHVE